jgi:AcrR family transcriptional regulator
MERLTEAAMTLFRERGYDRTTVEAIAARAGLTERTFFRYFADKREVLFSGAKELERLVVRAVAEAPPSAEPLEAVVSALQATAPMFEHRRAFARERQALVAANAELRERELIKLAMLASAIAEGLGTRGVERDAAGLAAETGIAVFKCAFERWVTDREAHDLVHHLSAALAQLRRVTALSLEATTAQRPAKARRRRLRASR